MTKINVSELLVINMDARIETMTENPPLITFLSEHQPSGGKRRMLRTRLFARHSRTCTGSHH